MAKKKPQAAYLAAPEDEPNFDALDQFLGGLEASKPAQELPNRGVLRGMADVALAGGRGAVQGVRMFTDLAGSDNAASRGLRTVEDFIGGLRSAQAKQDDQEAAAILKAAENAGILDQVVAGAKAFAVAPVSTLAQAVGTSIPTIGAALIPGVGQGAAVARMGAALGMGAAQGAGSVKGQIYDEVKQELLQAGASPEEAERRALEASSYDQSGGKIATGAALGALAGSTGMERAIGAIAHGTAKQAPGMARRVLTHGATEALPEAAQGAQEKLASNQALYEQGFDVAPGAGVVAAGTMEGLAGFGMGAAAGLPRPAVRAGDQLRAEGLQPERGPATRALNAAVEAAANKIDFDPSLAAAGQKLQGMAGLEQAGTAPGAAAPKQTFGNEIAYTPDPDTGRLAIGDATEIAKANIARTAAKHEPMPQDVADGIVAKATERGLNMVAVPHPEGGGFTVVPREWVTAAMAAPQAAPAGPSVAERAMQAAESLTLEGDPAVAAAEQEARRAQIQSAPVDRAPRVRTPEPAAPAPAVPADVVAAYVESRRNDGTPAGRFFATEFDAGRITRDEVQGLIDAARPKSPDQRLAEAAAQAPKPQAPQPGDILNPKGEPFRNMRAAEKVAQREGGSVIVVDGGWSVRPKEADARTSNAPEPGGPAGEPVADARRGAGTGELRDQRPADVQVSAAGAADEVRAGDGAAAVQPGRTGPASELTTDIPTLKRQWQAAVQAGDGATARAINDRIVALKANAAVQPATEAPASQAAAPGAVAAAPKANVPGAGGAAVEADGVTQSATTATDQAPVKQRKVDQVKAKRAAKAKPAQDNADAEETALRNGDFKKMLRLREERQMAERAAVGDISDGVVLRHEGGKRFVMVLPDVGGAGKWRIQRFDAQGFSGHMVFKNADEALTAALGEGFKARDDAALDKMQGTPEWDRGMFAADLIQKMNSGDMTREEGNRRLADYDAKAKSSVVDNMPTKFISSYNGVDDYGVYVKRIAKDVRVSRNSKTGAVKDIVADITNDEKNNVRASVERFIKDDAIAQIKWLQERGHDVPPELMTKAGKAKPAPAAPESAAPPTEGESRGNQAQAQAQEVLSNKPADVTTAGATATHADPGEAAEPATPAVVAESITKSAKREDRKPSEMKADLLRKIDQALATSKGEDDTDVRVYNERSKVKVDQRALDRRGLTGVMREKAEQEIERRIQAEKMKAAENIGYVEFDVPGDGRFKVLNTKDRLAEFRRKVESSPGFKDRAATSVAPDRVNGNRPVKSAMDLQNKQAGTAFGVERGSGTAKTAIEAMVDEGDAQAAVDYAAMKGLDLAEVLKGQKDRLAKAAGLTPTADGAAPQPEKQEAAPATNAGNVAMFSRRGADPVDLPATIIAGSLGSATSHPQYEAAKAGDGKAALSLAQDLVTDELAQKVRKSLNGATPLVLPVSSVEAAGRNKIPGAVAEVLAAKLGLSTSTDIVQSSSPKRTAMDGLDRLFNSPEFDGQVRRGADYLLVDDTLTQGGTFAALASHIAEGGGKVIGSVALTGKQYSATITLSPDLLSQVRERYADVEDAFRAATGYGFDALTESEARYLAKHDAPESVRSRIAEAGSQAVQRLGQGSTGQVGGSFSRATAATRRVDLASAQALADQLASTGLIRLNVVQSVSDMPLNLQRQLSKSAPDGRVRGAYFRGTDEVWMVADHIRGANEFVEVALHEAFHRGLGKTIPDAKPLLREIWRTNQNVRKATADQMRQHGIGRDEAIEEALAKMAEAGEVRDLKGWPKLLEAIRTWLGKMARAVGIEMVWTDDMVADLVAASTREGLKAGVHVDPAADAAAANRQSAFDRWFGDSKVVDASGRPLVVYHGTSADIESFDDRPTFFAASSDVASKYAAGFGDQKGRSGANVIPSFLAIKNPKTVDFLPPNTQGWYKKKRQSLMNQGYDGMIVGGDVYIAFRPEQIKSAIGNRGTFDPNDPDIRAKRAPAVTVETDEATGAPVYATDDISIGFPQETERFEYVLGDGEKIINYSIGPADGFDSYGFVELVIGADGIPKALADIEVKPELRGQGIGDKVMAAILGAHPGVDLEISNIVEGARGFWARMGVPEQNRAAGEAYDGTLNYETFQAAQDERAANRAAAGRGAAGEGRNAGTEDRAQGADGQAQGLMLSRAEPADATDMRSAPVVRQIQQRAHDLLATRRTFNWWHRTVGTQYHKAQVDADFGKVYTAAQDFIHDTSAFANDPADLAPDLLPQLKSLGDLKKTLGLNKRDRESMAAAVFEGTLDWTRDDSGQPVKAGPDDTAGIVWTPAELRERFGFNDRQVKLYEQFRASVDRSLDTLVASDVVRLLGSDLPPGMRALVSSGDLGRFKGLVTAFLQDAPGMGDVADQVAEKYDRIEELKARGYAPLMRFGRYTVDVVSEDGERKFFGLYESEAEANRAARQFKEGADPGDEVTQGVLSEEAYKQFQGMTPETLELFAEVAGVEKNEVFQEYLKRAKNNRSALKRLIHRKGIAGYSEDASRVLAQFLTSNARAASSNLHLGEMAKAVQDIPKQKGDVIDEAIRLREYVQTPQEEAQALRGLLFASFLGGSVASAMVNLTQPLMMTLPYLSQFGGPAKAAARLMGAMGAALGNYDRDSALGKALAMAEKEGIVSPQEMHQLQAEASGSLAGHPALRRLTFAWGSLFSAAEQFNRRLSFVAAYNTAVAEGKADPAAFAAKAVEETQGVYNKGNKPRFARGTVGAVAFTFKQYSVSYMEFLKRLPTRERTLALAVLLLASGAQGMPGADDLDDLIDTLGQGLGYDTNAKLWKTRVLSEAIGSDGADFVLRGFSALPGFPLDVAGRLGLGNMIPGTGLLMKSKQDKAGEVAEALGPAASLAKGVASAVPALASGNLGGVMDGLAPKGIKDLAKALEMYQTGEYRDTKGRKVTDADATDALVKGLGFQPAQVARDSRRVQMANQQIALAKATEAEFADAIARARVDGDPDAELKARQRLADWNANNPESRIVITPAQLARRARELRTTRDDRFVRTAPKEMRQSIKELVQ